MSRNRLIPLVLIALGFLAGGLFGAYLGAIMGREWLAAAGYVCGALIGVTVGGLLGRPWSATT